MRIAILIVGLTRTYQKTYQSLFDNIIKKYPEHEFDIFLTTWNIIGSVTKEKTIYKSNEMDQKWINLNEMLLEDEVELIKKVYQPKFFRMLNYQQWKSQKQPIMDEFIYKFQLESQRNLVEQSLFSQYYGIKMAMNDLNNYISSNKIQYDLIIKTRFDLFYGSKEINWNSIYQHIYDKNEIVSMKNWIPQGLSDQLIIGNLSQINKYAQLYDKLPTFTNDDMNNIKLFSFYLPDIYMHYDQDPSKINKIEFFKQNYQQIKTNVIQFLDQAYQFITPIIAERLLLYFLTKIQKQSAYFEEYINISIVRDDIINKADNNTYFKC